VVAAAAMLLVPAAAQGPLPRIPAAHGITLAGASVALPEAVKGKMGVLVVGFSKASQQQVTAWGRRLAADYRQSNDVAYFEIPMLGGAPKLLRGIIVREMGSSVPDRERPHFLPIAEDEAAWRAVTHYSKPDDAYVLLIDSDGVVKWQTEGDASDAAYGELKRRLEARV
jgi:hypothetical protein